MKKIGIRILGCMALLSMVGCGRIEGASVQDLSNTKDAIVESETTLAENNNEYSNKREGIEGVIEKTDIHRTDFMYDFDEDTGKGIGLSKTEREENIF